MTVTCLMHAMIYMIIYCKYLPDPCVLLSSLAVSMLKAIHPSQNTTEKSNKMNCY